MMVRYCHFGVSPVNYSDSGSIIIHSNGHYVWLINCITSFNI